MRMRGVRRRMKISGSWKEGMFWMAVWATASTLGAVILIGFHPLALIGIPMGLLFGLAQHVGLRRHWPR